MAQVLHGERALGHLLAVGEQLGRLLVPLLVGEGALAPALLALHAAERAPGEQQQRDAGADAHGDADLGARRQARPGFRRGLQGRGRGVREGLERGGFAGRRGDARVGAGLVAVGVRRGVGAAVGDLDRLHGHGEGANRRRSKSRVSKGGGGKNKGRRGHLPLRPVGLAAGPGDGAGLVGVAGGPDAEADEAGGLRVLAGGGVGDGAGDGAVDDPLDGLLVPDDGVVVQLLLGPVGGVVEGVELALVAVPVPVGLDEGGVATHDLEVDLVEVVGQQDDGADDAGAGGGAHQDLDAAPEDVEAGLERDRVALLRDGEVRAIVVELDQVVAGEHVPERRVEGGLGRVEAGRVGGAEGSVIGAGRVERVAVGGARDPADRRVSGRPPRPWGGANHVRGSSQDRRKNPAKGESKRHDGANSKGDALSCGTAQVHRKEGHREQRPSYRPIAGVLAGMVAACYRPGG
nr:hypothetical protein CFP56_19296 [Quercus suber]